MINEQKVKKALYKELDRINIQALETAKTMMSADEFTQVLQGHAIFENCSDGIIITDINQTIIKVNSSFSRITGYSQDEIIGKNASILQSGHHEKSYYAKIRDSLESTKKWKGEIWNRRKNGEVYLQNILIIALNGKNSKTESYIGIYGTVIEQNGENALPQNCIYHDSLTGLPNRILLHERLTFQINHAKRKNQMIAVLLLDLNRFKLINDTLGYSAGDTLLQTVATRLKSCLREIDLVFRLGDDEFAVILEDVSQQQDAARVAKRILSICSLPFQLSGREIYITISIGISVYPVDGEVIDEIMKNAEAAMLRAKEFGINNYQHYKPAMNSKAFEQLTLEHNMRKALRENEFIVYYQPLIDLKSGKIFGSEALVRWNSKELGMIQPGQFISIAEETGLILPLGEFVLRTACQQTREWQLKYNRKLSVSVNLSAKQFLQQDLVSTINSALVNSSLEPNSLDLEITESLGMKNPELTLRTLNELKSMGIWISIDDFGTGYSSLSYLKKFPINTIKIDRSFVYDVHNNSNDSAIIRAIIALAHSLNLKVIAEGVELKEQVDYLTEQGCEQVQGFYYSKPICASQFEKQFLDQDR
jgi:diguanylate cyclase (GGDEF)-like protein/PAS domain S-box-containing protein